MQRPQITGTSMTVTDDTGEVLLELSPQELVSFTPPLQPTTVNPGFYDRLEASTWRHGTQWYDREMDWIRDLRNAGSIWLADYFKVLLNGVFVVGAEMMGRQGMKNESAYPRYRKAFRKFVKEHHRSPPPLGVYSDYSDLSCDEFLETLEPSSYMIARLAYA